MAWTGKVFVSLKYPTKEEIWRSKHFLNRGLNNRPFVFKTFPFPLLLLLCKVPYLIYCTFSTRIDLHLVSVCKNTFYADIGVTQLTKQEEDPQVPVKEKLELPVIFLACLLFTTFLLAGGVFLLLTSLSYWEPDSLA